MHTVILLLTDDEVALLRSAVAVTGTSNTTAVSLQLKIANALLDSEWEYTKGRLNDQGDDDPYTSIGLKNI